MQSVNGKISSRRHSVKKTRQHMKEMNFRVCKKHGNISRQKQSTDAKHCMPSQEKLNQQSFDTTFDDQFVAELTELSTLDVNTLIDEMESFIENGEFESFVKNQDFDPTDLLLNSNSLSAEPELSTPVLNVPTDFIPPVTANEMFCLDEMGVLPLDLSIIKMESAGPPKVLSSDLSVNEIISTGQECKANLDTSNAQQIECTSLKSSANLCAYQNDLIESANSSTIPHDPANTLSACCSSNELDNSNAVTTSKLNKDLSPSANAMSIDSTIKSKKRNMTKPCQIFIQDYNEKKCTTITRKIINFPKLKKLSTDENISEALHRQAISQNFSTIHSKNQRHLNVTISQDDSRTISTISKKVSTPPQSSTTAQNSFAAMRKMVLRLLDQPCFKFLQNKVCGPYCSYNHLLPSAALVAATIKNWPDELIHHFYLTCVKQHKSFTMYFSVVCNVFAERQMVKSLLAAVKDCERLSSEHYFKNVFVGLMQCGKSPDQSLFLLCTNSNRSLASIEVILEIMCSSNLSNLLHTADFMSTQIENYDINPILAVKILEKGYADSPLNTVMRSFCTSIFRKSLDNPNFNHKLTNFFLTKILT